MKFPSLLTAILVAAVLLVPLAAAVSTDAETSAGALYTKSVDLANEGKYQEALDASDQALAMNVTALSALIQSNRAGILVMLHRDDEAITAADAALAVQGNLTTVYSIAWYNKGNALRALGRIAEAQDAYTHANALDNTLVPPDMSADITVATVSATPESSQSPARTALPSSPVNPPISPTQKSPLSALTVLSALGAFSAVVSVFRKQ